jgi:hypothetical protein
MSRSFIKMLSLCAGVVVLAVALAYVPGLLGRQADAGGGSADIAVGSGTVAPGGNITVDLVVTPTSGDVGSLTIDISFDAAVLDATAASAPTCNIAFDNDTIRCSFATLSGLSGVITTLTFNAIGGDGTSSALDLLISACTDTAAIDITCTPTDGNISVIAATPTASPSPSPTPSPTPARLWGDTNCDGTVNAVDSLAIQRWRVGLPVSQQPQCPVIGAPYP